MFKLSNIISVGLTVCILCAGISFHKYLGRTTAEEFVTLMYNFSNVGAIDTRYSKIRRLVTEDVYNQVTELDRTLRAYLKMSGKPSTVHILDEGDGYLLYELDCEAITPGRKFLILYDTNLFGKLNKVREMEVADFI